MPDPSGEARTAPGTMFPSLYAGGTPGDQAAGEDITGQILPDLTPQADRAPGTGSSLSVVPGAAPDDPTRQAAAQQAANIQGQAPTDRKPRSAQERIAQLTRRFRQAEDQNSNLSGQIQELLQISRTQSQELAALRQGRAPKAPEADADPTGSAAASASGPITLDAVRNVVREVVTNYDSERRAQDSHVQQMVASHEASFKEAALDLPELMDVRSRARQVFDEVYRSSPLKQLPDGPYQIALQVRGILADEQYRGQVAEARKVQVSAVAPSASVDMPHSELAAAQREFTQLTKLRQAGNEDFRVYSRWRKLRDFIAVNTR
jgi:TolA-binding protein